MENDYQAKKEVIDFFRQIGKRMGNRFSFEINNKNYTAEMLINEMLIRSPLGRKYYEYIDSLYDIFRGDLSKLFGNGNRSIETFIKAQGLVKHMIKD